MCMRVSCIVNWTDVLYSHLWGRLFKATQGHIAVQRKSCPWVKIQHAVLVCVFLHVCLFQNVRKYNFYSSMQTRFLKKYFHVYKQGRLFFIRFCQPRIKLSAFEASPVLYNNLIQYNEYVQCSNNNFVQCSCVNGKAGSFQRSVFLADFIIFISQEQEYIVMSNEKYVYILAYTCLNKPLRLFQSQHNILTCKTVS